jgi:RNA polymerase sigma factor (sigma-70 family)
VTPEQEAAEIKVFEECRELEYLGYENEALRLRHKLAEDHLGLVRYVAQRLHRRAPEHQPLEDFVGYGNIGLIQAVEKFDPDMGVKFATYAVQRIRGSILDGLRTEDSLSRSARRRVKDFDAVEVFLYEMYGREPSVKELAAAMGVENEEIGRIRLDALSTRRDIEAYRDIEPVSQGEDPELASLMQEMYVETRNRIKALTSGEVEVLYTHYSGHDGSIPEEVANILDKMLGKGKK